MTEGNYSESRRRFVRKSIITSGFVAMAPIGMTGMYSEQTAVSKLPHEVWIAGVSQMGLHTRTAVMMVDKIMEVLQEAIPCRPDFVCLPGIYPP